MKAIETRYKGYRMRSRLEARWAVYFDALGIYWHYEVEGFDLRHALSSASAGLYLPDFWLPQVKMWAEVKPDVFDSFEVRKCSALANVTGFPCLMLEGIPDLRPYWARMPKWGGPEESDYLIDGQYLHENRFYGNAFERGDDASGALSVSVRRAIEEAKSARFEHGETPAVGRVQ